MSAAPTTAAKRANTTPELAPAAARRSRSGARTPGGPLAHAARAWAALLLAAILVGSVGTVAHAGTLAGGDAAENSRLGFGRNPDPARALAEPPQAPRSPLENATLAYDLAVESAYATRGAAGAGGRGPNMAAEGAHTVFRREAGSTGRVSHYETFQPQTNPRNPAPWESVRRFDATGEGHFNKATQTRVPTPHVHDRTTPGGVRPALPDEMPLGW